MVIAFIYMLNSLASYFDINLVWTGYIGHISLLALVYFYISSFVYRFCAYHRMFLHYILVNDCINIYDYYIGMPLTARALFIIYLSLICSCLFLILYLYVKSHKRSVGTDSQQH